ncbi:hypothetical protein GE278_04210 [Enterobacteriaceae bacterium Kacie_13]|nr:hypothetical protein GE278_04210 [Enterobacteriaceae bacterium Kacie_13]
MKTLLGRVLSLSFVILAVSCSNIPNKSETVISPANKGIDAELNKKITQEKNRASQAELLQCKNNLDNIKVLDKKAYDSYSVRFNALMSEVKNYLIIRENVNNADQSTVDSMYKYKSDKLCSEISNSMLSALLKKGEALK